ncbi:MAG: glycoside hydrolase family 9 protein [Bacteroidales bacterium]|nr:glycoside hydrolase family 9 protein [Bacteroidales bacterium]
MKNRLNILISLGAILSCVTSYAQEYKINDLGYFEETGANVLVYSNQYNGIFCDEKTAGIELIQRGERLSTGGGVRLMNTPEQWDIYAELVGRTVDKDANEITVDFIYKAYDFKYKIKVSSADKGVKMAVYLDEPVPAELVGKAGMNLEFFPAPYFGKTYLMDGAASILPKHPAGTTEMRPVSEKVTQIFGLSTFDDRGRDEFIVAAPIATGHNLVLAPEDDDLRVNIYSDSEINLFDGRNLSQNGTFVVRTFLPGSRSGNVAEWTIVPSYDPEWRRDPNIGISQIGYTPAQKKVSVVELDKNSPVAAKAKIHRIDADGNDNVVLEPAVKEWGVFNNRYNYALIDFSKVTTPGLYYIEYDGLKTNAFPIDEDVYVGKWHTTMDVWLPAQMDHMRVKEGYRIWHDLSNVDDALQAPVNFEMHDGYRSGPETFTEYEPWEHIPGLGTGAWYDAGDFDIQAGTVIGMTSQLSDLWEKFNPERDQTFIDQKTQFVDMHRPDGTPDVIQQVEHGVINLIAQVENIGFVAQGIVQVNMWQYPFLGDGGSQTDGLLYNPSLQPYQIYGQTSGTRDDRVAFTSNYSPAGQMSTIAAMASAARVLKDYRPEVADKALSLAIKLWDENFEAADPANSQNTGRRMRGDGRINAAIQLWLTTGEAKYKEFFYDKVLAQLGGERPNLNVALSLYPHMDKAFQKKVKDAVPAFVKAQKATAQSTPYGVPVTGRGWGGNGTVISWAYNNYMVWKYFPKMIDPEMVLSGLNYLYGCHPVSNVSFVTSVGVNTKKVAYGNNRADYTVIPGGIVPGIMMMNPDYMEHKDDYPFLWGENECCTGTVPPYVMLSLACEEVAASLNK